jgi:hypothetical protein
MEQVLVSVIVVLAFAYATWAVMPRALRTRIAVAVFELCRRAGWKCSGAARLAEQINARPGCTSCETCKRCQAGITSSVDSERRRSGEASATLWMPESNRRSAAEET